VKLPPKNETPAAPITAATAATSPRTDAGQRLEGIRSRIGNNQLDPALGDLRQLMVDFPGTPAAVEASFMSAEVLEKLGRLDEAMNAHVEFLRRHNTDARAPDSRLRLAELTARAGRGDRENNARRMLGEIAVAYPRTAHSQAALQMKLRLEQGKRQRERDPVLGMEVPIVLPTLRAMAEQFPGTPMAMQALARLGELYSDLDQWERAAQSYVDLGTTFPNNTTDAWFRAAEIFERRLRDQARALDAYGKVPSTSPRYRDAQRKLTQK
jgi:TolA-binding protein